MLELKKNWPPSKMYPDYLSAIFSCQVGILAFMHIGCAIFYIRRKFFRNKQLRLRACFVDLLARFLLY